MRQMLPMNWIAACAAALAFNAIAGEAVGSAASPRMQQSGSSLEGATSYLAVGGGALGAAYKFRSATLEKPDELAKKIAKCFDALCIKEDKLADQYESMQKLVEQQRRWVRTQLQLRVTSDPTLVAKPLSEAMQIAEKAEEHEMAVAAERRLSTGIAERMTSDVGKRVGMFFLGAAASAVALFELWRYSDEASSLADVSKPHGRGAKDSSADLAAKKYSRAGQAHAH